MHPKDREILELRKEIRRLNIHGALLVAALVVCIVLLCYIAWLRFHIDQWPAWLPWNRRLYCGLTDEDSRQVFERPTGRLLKETLVGAMNY